MTKPVPAGEKKNRNARPHTHARIRNPIATLRELARISQEDFAVIVEVDVQFIYRVEAGLVNSVPARIFEDLSYYVDYETMTAEFMQQMIGAKRSVSEINQVEVIASAINGAPESPSMSRKLEAYVAICHYWYQMWALSCREQVSEYLGRVGYQHPPKTLSPAQYREWVMSYWPAEENTTHAFCRKFLIHPSTMQRWVNQKGSSAPPTIKKALAQAGINLEGKMFK